MFLKACHALLRMMLVALVFQFGNLAKVGMRKRYDDKYENQQKLPKMDNHLKQKLKRTLDYRPRIPLDDSLSYKLSLNGKFQPVSHVPTINLSRDVHNSSKSPKPCFTICS